KLAPPGGYSGGVFLAPHFERLSGVSKPIIFSGLMRWITENRRFRELGLALSVLLALAYGSSELHALSCESSADYSDCVLCKFVDSLCAPMAAGVWVAALAAYLCLLTFPTSITRSRIVPFGAIRPPPSIR
ncbi:MAG: hypothetical protein ACE5GA_06790, partial [Candidatus Zixiibacteriota bacterium]